MGNTAKRQRVRHGVSPLGPVARAAETRLRNEQRLATIKGARERKSRLRARHKQLVEQRQVLASKPPDEDVEDASGIWDHTDSARFHSVFSMIMEKTLFPHGNCALRNLCHNRVSTLHG